MKARMMLATSGLLACLLLVPAACDKPNPDDGVSILEAVNISNTTDRSEDPSCAVDSRGMVHVVWNERTGVGYENLCYAYRPRDGTWSAPLPLTDKHIGARNPALAVGPNDRLHLVWQDAGSGDWHILYSWYDQGGAWAIPETISPPGHIHPELAIDSAGRVHVCWRCGQIYWAVRDTNGTWSSHQVVGSGLDYRIAADPAGNVHLAYNGDYPGIDTGVVWYLNKPQGGAWSAPARISIFGWAGLTVGLAVDRAGNAHVAWMPLLGAEQRGGMYRMRAAGGQWGEQTFLFDDTLTAFPRQGCIAVGPSDGLYMPGGASQPDGGKRCVFYITKPASGGWSDTLIAGVVQRGADGYGMGFDAMVCDEQGRLHIVGTGEGPSPDPQQDNEEVYYLELDTRRRLR
jgi:hypothetical protein